MLKKHELNASELEAKKIIHCLVEMDLQPTRHPRINFLEWQPRHSSPEGYGFHQNYHTIEL